MILRVAVIGNSHVAALKRGWDRLSEDHPGVAFTFFASPGGSVGRVRFEDGSILPVDDRTRDMFARTAGSDRIELDAFDAVIVVGSSIYVDRLLDIAIRHPTVDLLPKPRAAARGQGDLPLRGQRATDKRLGLIARILRSGRRWLPGGRAKRPQKAVTQAVPARARGNERPPVAAVSDAVFQAMANARFTATAAGRIIAGIAAIAPGKPIYYVSTPFPAETITETPAGRPFVRLSRSGLADAAGAAYMRTLERFLAPHARLIRQPADTVVNGIMTRIDLATGSRGLADTYHSGDDLRHMNDEYGTAMMRAVLLALEGGPSRPA